MSSNGRWLPVNEGRHQQPTIEASFLFSTRSQCCFTAKVRYSKQSANFSQLYRALADLSWSDYNLESGSLVTMTPQQSPILSPLLLKISLPKFDANYLQWR